MIALLSGIAMTGKLSVADVGLTLGKLGMFLAVTTRRRPARRPALRVVLVKPMARDAN
jgi:hypothetical protein